MHFLPFSGRWVKTLESRNGLRVHRANDPQLLRALENAIRIGCPVLLEDCGETLEPGMDPLLSKKVFTHGKTS